MTINDEPSSGCGQKCPNSISTNESLYPVCAVVRDWGPRDSMPNLGDDEPLLICSGNWHKHPCSHGWMFAGKMTVPTSRAVGEMVGDGNLGSPTDD